MKTTGAFCFGDEPSGYPSGDPEEILSSEGSEDAETSPPCSASLWLGVEDFLGLTALLYDLRLYGSLRLHNVPLIQPSCQPSLHFQMGILVICGMKHRLIESEK